MRHPATHGPTVAGRNLCAILDDIEARGERVPRYYESHIHDFFRDTRAIVESNVDLCLKMKLLAVLLSQFNALISKPRIPLKLQTHAKSIARSQHRTLFWKIETERRERQSFKQRLANGCAKCGGAFTPRHLWGTLTSLMSSCCICGRSTCHACRDKACELYGCETPRECAFGHCPFCGTNEMRAWYAAGSPNALASTAAPTSPRP